MRNHDHIKNHTLHRKPHPGDMFWHFKRGGELSPGLHKTTHPLRFRRIHSRGPFSYHRGDAAFARGSHSTHTLCGWGNTPYGNLQQDERGGRTACRRQHLHPFDHCFDRSCAGATDHLVLSTREKSFHIFGSFYACSSPLYCFCFCCLLLLLLNREQQQLAQQHAPIWQQPHWVSSQLLTRSQ